MKLNNEIPLSEGEKQVLDAMLSLEIYPFANEEEEDEKIKKGDNIPSNRENLRKRAILIKTSEGEEAKLADWKNSFKFLIESKLIQVDNDIYSLTSSGRKRATQVRTERIGNKFSDLLIRCDKSKAHATFCTKVFGKNLCQANIMDMELLEKLLEVLKLTSKNRVLDLACGVGRIAEYISDTTQAYVLGIDIATDIIKYNQERTQEKITCLEYKVGDINNLDLPRKSFDTIIAVAALHFTTNLTKTIEQLKSILSPNGQMGLFTFQYCSDNDSPEILLPENTNLGKALKKNDLSFKTWDFTEKEKEIRRKQVHYANELREQYQKEGNIDICEGRIEENELDLPQLESGNKRRYLYYVKIK